MKSKPVEKERYYVYRLINQDGVIVYVGRTNNLCSQNLLSTCDPDEISKIEYIECPCEAEMMWKRIYYINLYYNDLSKNVLDVYQRDGMIDAKFGDIWKTYEYDSPYGYIQQDLLLNYNDYLHPSYGYDYKSLVHISDHIKINKIGEDPYALSRQWFKTHCDDDVTSLRNHLSNYFKNIITKEHPDCQTTEIMWTSYADHKNSIKNKGNVKRYIPFNEPESEKYIGKKYLAYMANIFYPAIHDPYPITEDEYSLAHLLKFMLRSALREGKEIWIYIPSSRMRNLLKEWINENSENSQPQTANK